MSAPSIYLNAAGTSWPKPEPVQQAILRALTLDPAQWPQAFDIAHARIADYFGVQDPSRLLLTPGCTSALSVGIQDHDWQAGDRVLISSHEHLALLRPALALKARGVQVVIAPSGAEQTIDLDFVKDTLRNGGVRLVAFSAASNVTGALAPVKQMLNLAHEHGALCLVDAAQVAGWLPIDVRTLPVDMLAFAGHKALQGPWGLGGLYIAPHVQLRTPRLQSALDRPGYCDVGSVDRLALHGLEAALEWLQAPERAARLAKARTLAEVLWRALSDLPEVTLHGPQAPEARLPTVAMTCAQRSPQALAEALRAEGILASAGQQCAPLAHRTLGTEAQGVLRLSVGLSTSRHDVMRTAQYLSTIYQRQR